VSRPARAEDAAAVAALLRTSKAVAMPWLAVVHPPEEDLAWVGGVLLPTGGVRVVEQDGEVVAVCAVEGSWVEQLYVAPGAQGRGLGRALLDEAKAGRDVLDLHVFARNARARRFYAAAGFVEVGAGDGSGNEEREPDLHLRWTRP
jgi:putative acetyltransferase